MAITNSVNVERGSSEKILPYLTRSYEAAAGLQKTIPTPPSATAVRAAVEARLEASRTKGIAIKAATSASHAIKALPPRASTSYPQAGTIARQIAAAATAAPALAFLPDSKLIEAATHPLAPDDGRAAAIQELRRRGFSLASNGIVSKNLKTPKA